MWDGVQDLVALNDEVQKVLAGVLGVPGRVRDPLSDALAQEALLALASDWAFMVTKDSAASYARDRARDSTPGTSTSWPGCGRPGLPVPRARAVASWPATPFGARRRPERGPPTGE